MIHVAKEKLAEKDISWHEAYTEKTKYLKEQYDEIIGPGSYFRYEGKDHGSDAEYYCIIGPAKVHDPKAKFFAGVRRLPATYSAGGKYFDSLDAAAKYAETTWGIKTPKKLRPYTSLHLEGLSKKIDKWKENKEVDESDLDDKKSKETESSNGDKMKITAYVKEENDFIIQEAMGYQRQQNRSQYDWWDYQDLVGGGDDEWQAWLQVDPSVESIIGDATEFRGTTIGTLKSLYGITTEDVNKIFKTYIGYHPSYGAYICSIGPYKAEYYGTAKDKFGYFILRRRRSSAEEIADSVNKNINNYMKKFNVELEPSDFKFVLKKPSSVVSEGGRGENKEVHEVVESLDPNNPSTQQFLQRSPMASTSSIFALNNKGTEKLMRARFGNLYQRTLEDMANRMGITVDEVVQRELSNPNFIKEVYKAVQKKYKESVATGEAALSGMPPPPSFSNFIGHGKSGAVKFTKIPTNALQVRIFALRKEIATIMASGISEPLQITERLNQHSARTNIRIPLEDVQDHVREITRMMEQNNFTINDAESKISEQMQQLEDASKADKDDESGGESTGGSVGGKNQKLGFDDLATAFSMAKIYFSSVPVDKATGSKLGVQNIARMAFDPPENFVNVTSEQLRVLREAKEATDRANAPEGQEGTEADIENAIGPEQEVGQITEPEASPNQIEQTKEPTPTDPTTVNPELANLDDDDDSELDAEIKRLYSNTVKNLIKMSAELDNEGKHEAAEDIHKIIRKYQDKI